MATETDEKGPTPTVIDIVHNWPAGDKQMDGGYSGSGSEFEDDKMDGFREEEINSQDELEQEYKELRMDIAKESAEGATPGDGNSEGEDSEFDEWKRFDEEAEAGWFDNLSESDRLSKLDDMLESDNLAADAYEAEGWQNCLSFFRIQMTRAIRFFFRKRIFN